MTLTLERAKATRLQVTLVTRENPTSCRIPVPYIQNIRALQYDNLKTIDELGQVVPGFLSPRPISDHCGSPHSKSFRIDPSIRLNP